MEKPYYYNYEISYRLMKRRSEDSIPSFSLIKFFENEVGPRVRENLSNRLQVLELGCGQGSFFSAVEDKNLEVLGIDISSTAIEEAVKNQAGRLNFSYLCADVCQLRLEKKFNLVFDAHLLHCLCGENERKAYFQSVFEHTAEGGFFALETMVAHKLMDFSDGFYFHEGEQTLFQEIDESYLYGTRTFYGHRYMPIRSIRRAHEIEAELIAAGFRIIYFQVLSGFKVIYDEKRLNPERGDPDLLRIICRKI